MNAASPSRMPAGPARFTATEFLGMRIDGVAHDIRLELIRGELYRRPLPGARHGRWHAAIVAALGRAVPLERLRAAIGLDLGGDAIVAADAAVLHDRVAGDGMIPAAAVLLAVEVAVSTRDHDLTLKRHLYAEAGVPHLWVVDAKRELIHVFDRPSGDDYLRFALVRFGEPLAVPGCEGTIVLG